MANEIAEAMHTERNLLALYKACTELAVTTQGAGEESL